MSSCSCLPHWYSWTSKARCGRAVEAWPIAGACQWWLWCLDHSTGVTTTQIPCMWRATRVAPCIGATVYPFNLHLMHDLLHSMCIVRWWPFISTSVPHVGLSVCQVCVLRVFQLASGVLWMSCLYLRMCVHMRYDYQCTYVCVMITSWVRGWGLVSCPDPFAPPSQTRWPPQADGCGYETS